VLRWLARLFGQRDETATVPAAAPPPPIEPPAPPQATADPIAGDLQASPPTAGVGTEEAAVAVSETELDESAAVDATATTPLDGEGKETCPVCGRTSVFAGPPGQRFCTYCALRDELFERSAAATSSE
jgi:hypothetical protein